MDAGFDQQEWAAKQEKQEQVVETVVKILAPFDGASGNHHPGCLVGPLVRIGRGRADCWRWNDVRRWKVIHVLGW
jgi:hypothetical protein